MIQDLTLDQLRILTMVAETGSFSAAGRRLGRAQSAISQNIANLEAALGVVLFDRSGWRPQLTDAGRVLVADADQVLAGLDGMKARARGLAGGLEAEVSIVFDVLFSTCTLVDLATGFQRAFPTTGLNLRIEALGGVPDLVLSGDCVLGVQGSLPEIPAGLGFVPLPDPVALEPVAAPDHPLSRQTGPVTRHDLNRHHQIVLTDRSKRTEGRAYAVLSRQQIRTADLGSKQALLKGGLGWGFMPRETVQNDLDAGRLVVLDLAPRPPETRNMPLSLIYRRDILPGPAARWFVTRLTGQAGLP